MKVTSTTMELGVNIPGKPPPYYPGYSFNFGVQLDGFDRLALETGEVLEDPAWAKERGTIERRIKAALILREMLEETQYESNEMTYIEQSAEYDDPSSIQFSIFLPRNEFWGLIRDIRAGLVPLIISVRLQYDIADEASPIKIVAVENGSEIVWKNSNPESRRVKVQGISFSYKVNPSWGEAQEE